MRASLGPLTMALVAAEPASFYLAVPVLPSVCAVDGQSNLQELPSTRAQHPAAKEIHLPLPPSMMIPTLWSQTLDKKKAIQPSVHQMPSATLSLCLVR